MRGLALVAVMFLGCGDHPAKNDAGVADAEIDADEGSGFRVIVGATGVRAAQHLVLTAGTSTQDILMTEDGDLRFPHRLVDGTAFSVAVVGTLQTCDVAPGSPTIQGADAHVTVTCDGVLDVDISFDHDVHVIPRFDPRVASVLYTGNEPLFSVVPGNVTVTTMQDPSTSVIAPPPFALGFSPPYDLHVVASHAPFADRDYHFSLAIKATQEAYVKSHTPAAGKHFGGMGNLGYEQSLALTTDTLAVGVPDEAAVYVYVRTGMRWSYQATITHIGGAFGGTVALAGDLLVVGAPQEGTGAVYVSHRTNGAWSAPGMLQMPASVSAFGSSVAIASTGSGSNIVAGSPNNDTAYIYRDDGTLTWSTMTPLSGPANSKFGRSVAVTATTVAVGAPLAAGGFGTISVYDAAGNPAGTITGDVAFNVGTAIALDGDLIATGSPLTTVGGHLNAGAVNLYRGPGWALEKQLTAPSAVIHANDKFGTSVAVKNNHVVVGIPGDLGTGSGVEPPYVAGVSSSGAIYAFVEPSAHTWDAGHYIKASNPANADAFGTFVAASDDSFATNAPGEDSKAKDVDGNQADDSVMDSGAVYVFR